MGYHKPYKNALLFILLNLTSSALSLAKIEKKTFYYCVVLNYVQMKNFIYSIKIQHY